MDSFASKVRGAIYARVRTSDPNRQVVLDGSGVLSRDDSHLSTFGSTYIATAFDQVFDFAREDYER